MGLWIARIQVDGPAGNAYLAVVKHAVAIGIVPFFSTEIGVAAIHQLVLVTEVDCLELTRPKVD